MHYILLCLLIEITQIEEIKGLHLDFLDAFLCFGQYLQILASHGLARFLWPF